MTETDHRHAAVDGRLTPQRFQQKWRDAALTERAAAQAHFLDLHAALDRAVWVAYGWADDPNESTDEEILGRLLALNLERAGAESS